MSTYLAAVFLESAARHACVAKNHKNCDVREFEREHMEYAFQNALSCRDLPISYRNELVMIRSMIRKDLQHKATED